MDVDEDVVWKTSVEEIPWVVAAKMMTIGAPVYAVQMVKGGVDAIRASQAVREILSPSRRTLASHLERSGRHAEAAPRGGPLANGTARSPRPPRRGRALRASRLGATA